MTLGLYSCHAGNQDYCYFASFVPHLLLTTCWAGDSARWTSEKAYFEKEKIIEHQLRSIELSSVPRSENYYIRKADNMYMLEQFSIVCYRTQITLMKEMIHFPVFRVVNWLQVYSVIINEDATVVVREIWTVWFLHL